MIEWTIDTLKALIDERFVALDKALELQAAEYERRLAALNHAHEKAVAVQHTYVTQEKYEDRIKSEDAALAAALLRVDERFVATDNKFSDYVKTQELRQREIDLALSASKGAAEQAARAAEEQGRKSNRNMGILALVLTAVVAAANYSGAL
jgi:hypothetical protein